MRLQWVDTYKGILISFVVLGHVIQGLYGSECFNNRLWNFIYSFHMPCFFVASGFFAPKMVESKNVLFSLIVRRCRQLIIPMVLWQAIFNLTPPLIVII